MERVESYLLLRLFAPAAMLPGEDGQHLALLSARKNRLSVANKANNDKGI